MELDLVVADDLRQTRLLDLASEGNDRGGQPPLEIQSGRCEGRAHLLGALRSELGEANRADLMSQPFLRFRGVYFSFSASAVRSQGKAGLPKWPFLAVGKYFMSSKLK